MSARVLVPSGISIPALVAAAGADPDGLTNGVTYDLASGVLTIPGVEQAAAEAALAAYAPPEPTLAEAVAAKLAALAARRYEAETGGIEVNGVSIRTDRESQGLVLGLIKRLEESPEGTTQRFKAASGWVVVDLPTIKAVGLAIGIHVGACFEREGQLAEAIEAAETPEDLSAIDITAGWPG
jgi:hypothetical protein